MKLNNKKGIGVLYGVIIGFAIFAMMYFFMSVLVYETGKEYVIQPMAETGKQIISDNVVPSVNASVSAKIDELQADYNGYSFRYDLFFLLVWITAFVSTVWVSFKANKEGIFSFMGYLFLGSMFVLLMTSFVSDFVSWFLTEVFYKLFDDVNIPMPIFMFYLSNLGVINFFWWLVVVTINIIDRSFVSKTGEVEE
jgi:hypothetical protein